MTSGPICPDTHRSPIYSPLIHDAAKWTLLFEMICVFGFLQNLVLLVAFNTLYTLSSLHTGIFKAKHISVPHQLSQLTTNSDACQCLGSF